MSRQHPSAYQTTEILTADPGRLILLLYDGALRALREARESLARGQHMEKFECLDRAENIVAELMGCLDEEKGGEIARQLKSLYAYVLKRILDANLKGDEKAIDECLRILGTLRDAWQTILQKKPDANASAPSARGALSATV